jgi:hypothetical protein
VSESYVSLLVSRFRVEGEAAYEARSRRPLRSPTTTSERTVSLIVDLRVQLIGKGLHGRLAPRATPRDQGGGRNLVDRRSG